MNRTAVMILTLFVGVGAVFGGLGLISEADLGMDPAWLDGTPFDSYVIPGYLLLIVVGGSNLLAGVLVWMQHERSAPFAFLAGTILTGWIVVQLAMIGFTSVLQPLYFVLGLMTMAFAYRYWLETAELA